jgi:TetR/AcrR family transcriptional regulator, lmrAB and yxaGH operons repressor
MTQTQMTKRDLILRTAWRLFEAQGYHSTGINQIISESGVPKGSFYHYFPDGKEGMAIEAIDAISDGMCRKVDEACSTSPDPIEAVAGLIREIASRLEQTGYQEGGPLTTVALETATTNERINEACQRAYNNVHRLLVKHLRAGGFSEHLTPEVSTTILAGIEGAILFSRTFHSTTPMEQLARQIETTHGRKHRIQDGSQVS